MSVKILGPKPYFFQWDSGRKLIVDNDQCGEVHFCNGTDDCAMVVPIKKNPDGTRTVDVPNILLQTAKPIRVFLFQKDGSSALTIVHDVFQVISRRKPDDYVYTETEALRYSDLAARIDYLEKHGVSDETIGAAVKKYLDENPVDTGVQFDTDHTLTLKDGILSVNTTDQMEQDNTLPMTSAGVYAQVGNIEALLKTI